MQAMGLAFRNRRQSARGAELAREAARERLYKDDAEGARKILRDCLKKQAAETVGFFKTLK